MRKASEKWPRVNGLISPPKKKEKKKKEKKWLGKAKIKNRLVYDFMVKKTG